MSATLNALVGGVWTPVDLRGPVGDPGPAGPAGAFTWPTSNQRDYTNSVTGIADGTYEPGPLVATNPGVSPSTRVATNTSRIEVVTAGLLMVSLFFSVSAGTTGNNAYVNIRNVTTGDSLLAAGWMELTDVQVNLTSLSTVAAGDVIRFIGTKAIGATGNIGFVVRAALIT